MEKALTITQKELKEVVNALLDADPARANDRKALVSAVKKFQAMYLSKNVKGFCFPHDTSYIFSAVPTKDNTNA